MTTFVKVVETGKLSTAAKALRLSLPAVSRQVSALEEAVGGALILRSTRTLTVTEAGRRYYEHCLRILREVETAQSSVRAGDTLAGLLTVSAPVTFGLARVSPHLAALIRAHPGLRIDLRLEDRIIDLVAEGVDIVLRGGSPPPDSAMLIAHPLTTYKRVVVAAPSYFRRRAEPKTPADLTRHDALIHLGATGIADRWQFSKDGIESAVELRGPVRTNAVYTLRESALAGLGIAMLPDWIVADDVAAGRLKILLQGFATPPTTVSAIHRTELRGAQRVKVFIDHLLKTYEHETVR